MKKKLITVICLFSLSMGAQASVKDSLRSFLTNVIGTQWTETILGKEEVIEETSIKMPVIPTSDQLKLTTSTEAQLAKGETEFDRLPNERIRQYNFNFLQELFEVTRRTEARDEDLSIWMNTLDQGGSREGIYQALVLDGVYNTLESIENSASDGVYDFVVSFSQMFLNQTVAKTSLEQLNHYSLKRILTDKGIDVMAYYQTKSLDDLYRWYALFSSYVARNHASSFNGNAVRANTSPEYHYEWAKSMPIQHIKSEFIIKMHKVMNDLQEA